MHIFTQFILPCAYAFLACAGFCLLYNIRGFGIVLCSLGGALGWLVYLLAQAAGASTGQAAFCAGVSIAAYAEVMARVRKCPASGYLLLAFFPLVPGSGIYYTVRAYFQGDAARLSVLGRQTLGMAGGLAIGVLLVSSAVRMLHHMRGKRRVPHAPL